MDRDMRRGEISTNLPSTGEMMNMGDVFIDGLELEQMAYEVAWNELNLVDEKIPACQKDIQGYSFLKPKDPQHAYYLHRVMYFKTLLQARIPGIPCSMMEVPMAVVVFSDLAAQGVSLEGGQELEEWFLAHPEDIVHDCYFIKPDDIFHPLYQHRLEEHRRRNLNVQAEMDGEASAAATVPNPTAFRAAFSMLSINEDGQRAQEGAAKSSSSNFWRT